MTHDRRAALALRRRLLVVEAGLQRQHLRREAQALQAVTRPAAWVASAARLVWRWWRGRHGPAARKNDG